MQLLQDCDRIIAAVVLKVLQPAGINREFPAGKKKGVPYHMKFSYLKKRLWVIFASLCITAGSFSVYAEELTSDETVVATVAPDPPAPTPAAPVDPAPQAQPEIPVTPVPQTPAPETPQTPAPGQQETPAPQQQETPAQPQETPSSDPSASPSPEAQGTEELTDTPSPSVEPSVEPGIEPSIEPSVEPSVTVEPSVEPSVEPFNELTDPETSPTETPEAEVSPTETPTPEPTPTEEPTPTPIPEHVKWIIEAIEKLKELEEITLDQRETVEKIRDRYDKLTGEEKDLIENYKDFLKIEEEMNRLIEEEEELVDDEKDVKPVVYYVSNLKAGKEFYINSLKSKYHLGFAQDFGSVMDEIEHEYKIRNGLMKEDEKEKALTTSGDTLLVRNWQDILAIYVYRHHKAGEEEFLLDASAKQELAEIFEEMNPLVRNKVNIEKFSYANRHIDYYIRNNKLRLQDREFLRRYVETDCKLLCAVSTGAKGFVRQSVGDSVSEERVNVITAAYSLIGKVGYFWGGKSEIVGLDSRWGSPAMVWAEGSTTTGTVRAFGLDCSGFVTWSVINGYKNSGMLAYIGHGTSSQWFHANVVSAADAQPGDLVFQKGPENGSDNHVGILCGQTDSGDWIAVHCTASKNGITVGEAYSASFRYIRQPAFFPSDAQVEAMIKDELTDGGVQDTASGESVAISGTGYLDDLISGGTGDLSSGYVVDVVLIDNSEVELF